MSIEYLQKALPNNRQILSTIATNTDAKAKQRALERRLKEYQISFSLSKKPAKNSDEYEFVVGGIDVNLLKKIPKQLAKFTLPISQNKLSDKKISTIMVRSCRNIVSTSGWKKNDYMYFLSLTESAYPQRRVSMSLYTLYELLHGSENQPVRTKSGKDLHLSQFAKALLTELKMVQNPPQAVKDARFWLESIAEPTVKLVKVRKKIVSLSGSDTANPSLMELSQSNKQLSEAVKNKDSEHDIIKANSELLTELQQDNIDNTLIFLATILNQQTFLVDKLTPEQRNVLIKQTNKINPSDLDMVRANIERNNNFNLTYLNITTSLLDDNDRVTSEVNKQNDKQTLPKIEKDTAHFNKAFNRILHSTHTELLALQRTKDEYISKLTNQEHRTDNNMFFQGAYLNASVIIEAQIAAIDNLKTEMAKHSVTYGKSKGLFDYFAKRYERYKQVTILTRISQHLQRTLSTITNVSNKHFSAPNVNVSVQGSIQAPDVQASSWQFVKLLKSLWNNNTNHQQSVLKPLQAVSAAKISQEREPVLSPTESTDYLSEDMPWVITNQRVDAYFASKSIYNSKRLKNDYDEGYLADEEDNEDYASSNKKAEANLAY